MSELEWVFGIALLLVGFVYCCYGSSKENNLCVAFGGAVMFSASLVVLTGVLD